MLYVTCITIIIIRGVYCVLCAFIFNILTFTCILTILPSVLVIGLWGEGD